MGLTANEITENTTLWVTVTVRKGDGTPKALAGASFTALLANASRQVTGIVLAVDLNKGVVQLRFPAATGMDGWATASLHVTINGETQCVWRDRFQVFTNIE
jgi:hypothetical protein